MDSQNLRGGGTGQRDNALDMMKGFLTVLMVLSHLTYVIPFSGIDRFNTYVNLTTFSGFMFCFGYACWKAYIEKDREDAVPRLLQGALKSLTAFYICGLGRYMRGTAADWASVILLQKIPGMTEFLFSFSLMYIMVIIFRRQMKKLSWRSGILIVVISLAVTAVFPFELIISPLMGSIFGTTAYYCFPLAAYLGYFIMGSLLAKYQTKFDGRLFLITCISTGLFLGFCRRNGTLPGRFPPTIWWILGAGLPVYFYYCIFRLFSVKGKDLKPLIFVGKHTLVFLVVSNLLLFILWNDLVDEKIWEVLSLDSWGLRYMIFVAVSFGVSWSAIRMNEWRKIKRSFFGWLSKQ